MGERNPTLKIVSFCLRLVHPAVAIVHQRTAHFTSPADAQRRAKRYSSSRNNAAPVLQHSHQRFGKRVLWKPAEQMLRLRSISDVNWRLARA